MTISENKRWHGWLFVTMVVVGAVAGFFSYEKWQAGDHEDSSQVAQQKDSLARTRSHLSPPEVLAAMELKDVSLGHLENGPIEVPVGDRTVSGLLLAAQGFAKLSEILPDQKLPVRNLAIARLLLFQNSRGDTSQLKKDARQAAEALLEFDQTSTVARWLLAKVELQMDASNPLGASDQSRERAIAGLQTATELDPDNPILWLALYQAADTPDDRHPNQLAQAALAAAYHAAPRNLYLLTEWLMVQANLQDPKIVETLAESKKVLLPLAVSIQQRARLDIAETIDQAIAAAKQDDWKTVPALVRRIQFTVRPEEVSKSDLASVDVHPLIFVLYDFDPEFHAQYQSTLMPADSAIPVQLVPRQDAGLSELAAVEAIKLIDYNLNGRREMVILQPGKLRIFSASDDHATDNSNGPWVESLMVDIPSGMTHILAADLDRDRRGRSSPGGRGQTGRGQTSAPDANFDRVVAEGTSCYEADPDFVLYGPGGVVVLENDEDPQSGTRQLTQVDTSALGALKQVTAGVMVDFDHDGDLDLVFASAQGISLWLGIGNLQFRDVSRWSVLPATSDPITSIVAVDWDRDVDIDLLLGNGQGAEVGYLENLRHGQFRWVAMEDQSAWLSPTSELAILDADGNVSWDLLAVGDSGARLTRTATPRSGIVKTLGFQQLTDTAQSGVLTWDFDNDGIRDAAVWGSTGLHIFRGTPDGVFAPAPLLTEPISQPVRHVACADIDGDGDEDLAIAFQDHVSLLINDGGNKNHWLAISPMGRADNRGRCNQGAVGSLVELRSGGQYQAQVVQTGGVHFGLGTQETADLVRIVWTNGIPQDIVQARGNVAICEKMTLKGSCPYVYTMVDGQFEFLTDCLWAAPLGLVTSDGQIMPTRAWEYLRIPGERLTPHDGGYWIQLTEELWEAGYFDQVQLIAVDHPADVEVYSNEKVGPSEIAQFKIHTVRDRQLPVTARDSQGRDVLDLLRERDGQFVKAFEHRFQQGLTEEHFLELDLGQLESPEQVTLFLTGWIFPTDTSLNLAFMQDPNVDGPYLPSVWTVNEQGEWQKTIPFMGFPGGKTKTIAVDLSDAFLTTDYRVRIQTSAEIYWDEAFFSVDEEPVEIRQTRLALESAELHYRGCSQALPYVPNSPQIYDHSKVITEPIWPPMRGKFTRFGSVLELLHEADDMMAVLGAGDAITLKFPLPEQAPPAGWKRDFLLYSVGWNKDADLNTIYGQTVEPLPFRAMSQYPYTPEDPYPDSAAYREYLRKYQTREQNPSQFWRALQ